LEIRLDNQKRITQYGLTGGIVHKGSAISGHYLSLTSTPQGWYKIDDTKVTKVSEKEAIQQLENDGVLIIYQKIRTTNMQNDLRRESDSAESKDDSENKPYDQFNTKNRRQDFFRAKKPFSPKRRRWRKIYIKKQFYDPDKNCFYIPKA